MPVYPFYCETCGSEAEVTLSIYKYDTMKPPRHCNRRMTQRPAVAAFKQQFKPGKESGFYDQDYGKRATEDLTVPGKFERLKREGRCVDPFDDMPRQHTPKEVVDEVCGV